VQPSGLSEPDRGLGQVDALDLAIERATSPERCDACDLDEAPQS
jgi:hypothetical protein